MDDIYKTAAEGTCLTKEEIRSLLLASLEGRALRKVLILPPDFTRLHSGAGFITNVYYHVLTERGCRVDILPALGTHSAMTDAQLDRMFGDIPHERFLVHHWRTDVVRLGLIPGEYIAQLTEGLWDEAVEAEVNRLVTDGSYDLVISVGQVVPHEVIGMSNHAKNLFVGVGGADMINKSHMIGAVYGMERMMGRDNTPVRQLFDYGMEHFLADRPILFVLTVATARGADSAAAPRGEDTAASARREDTAALAGGEEAAASAWREDTSVHGVFIGAGRQCLTEAVKFAQRKSVTYVDRTLKKCVVYLDPEEFKSTWLGNKAVYRTCLAMAEDGELLILAPGVRQFGEDPEVDRLIRKYGYRGRRAMLEAFRQPENGDLRENMAAAAHMIHGRPDKPFTITYAAGGLTPEEVRGVGYEAADCEEMMARYDITKLRDGFNDVDGEEIYYVSNPAIGLWVARGQDRAQ